MSRYGRQTANWASQRVLPIALIIPCEAGSAAMFLGCNVLLENDVYSINNIFYLPLLLAVNTITKSLKTTGIV